jgi:hypothetical protein
MSQPKPPSRPRSWLRRPAGAALVVVTAAVLGLGVLSGTALAVSGGGYSPQQQGCRTGDADYATPNGTTYPGCHNVALNVESGGTHQGRPGNHNTEYVQYGNDQAPNDPRSQGTPTPYSIGEPGSTGSPHAGCVAVNTDGTRGRPAPAGSPEAPGRAEDSRYGCGNNPKGAGVEVNYDYYQYYCPIAGAVGLACEDTSPGTTSVTPDTGHHVAYQPLVKNGVLVYFGMDDNTDNGEHDGVGPYSAQAHQNNGGAQNGPSDGGAIMLIIDPSGIYDRPSQTRPEGVANLSAGSCADGICAEATTQRQTVYHGCGAADSHGQAPCDQGTPRNANVYNYAPGGSPANDPSVNSEPSGCNSGGAQSTSESACGSGGMDAYRSATPANENAEPGVQVYSDPDPQRSPAAPSPLWPTPAVYVGTCGVYMGSPGTTGQLLGTKPVSVAGEQVTNQAGQVAVDPNPSAC